MSRAPVITRFAPSPSGALHVGGARTALFNWAFARRHGGQFILRIEDTDRARSTPESTKGFIRDLSWLGLAWDQGPNPKADNPYLDQIGQAGPYFQSQRLDLYGQQISRLVESGRAYVPKDEPTIVRFRRPEHDITVHDEVRGDVTIQAAELEDFVIQKSDGFPTFHLAVVVDDAAMGITHVIRGQEHLMNTSKHWALQDALGFEHPTYAHLPVFVSPEGGKMSKRDKAKFARKAAQAGGLGSENSQAARFISPHTNQAFQDFMAKKSDDIEMAQAIAAKLRLTLPEIDVADFRISGYLPEVLINYISLLGWSPAQNIERFDLAFLVQNFSLERINKANAQFDRDKLSAFNARSIAQLSPAAFEKKLCDHLREFRPEYWEKIGDRFDLFAQMYQERSRTLDESALLGRFVITADQMLEYDAKAIRKVLAKNNHEGFAVLRDLAPRLESYDDWSASGLETLLQSFAQERGQGLGKVAQPLRVAVSGGTVSPPIGQTLVILGKESTLARIERCLQQEGTQ